MYIVLLQHTNTNVIRSVLWTFALGTGCEIQCSGTSVIHWTFTYIRKVQDKTQIKKKTLDVIEIKVISEFQRKNMYFIWYIKHNQYPKNALIISYIPHQQNNYYTCTAKCRFRQNLKIPFSNHIGCTHTQFYHIHLSHNGSHQDQNSESSPQTSSPRARMDSSYQLYGTYLNNMFLLSI